MDAPSTGRTPDQWFDVTALQDPAPGTGGNIGPQTGVGPGIANLDLSLFKTFEFNERYRLQFRSEWLNMSNTPRFAVSSIGNTQGASDLRPAVGYIARYCPQRAVCLALYVLKF